MEERVIKKQKWDPWGGSTLIITGINEESSLFFRVVCVNVFSYHIDVISSYCKASYRSFLLNGKLKLLKILVKQQFYCSSFI